MLFLSSDTVKDCTKLADVSYDFSFLSIVMHLAPHEQVDS